MKISGELVYKDVENTFIEAGHHEAAASCNNFHFVFLKLQDQQNCTLPGTGKYKI